MKYMRLVYFLLILGFASNVGQAQNNEFTVPQAHLLNPIKLKTLLESESSKGSTLVFPAGVFDLGGLSVQIQSDLKLTGAGKTQTILANGNRMVVSGSVEVTNLTFKDWQRSLYGGATENTISIKLDGVGFDGFDYACVWQEGDPIITRAEVTNCHFQNAGKVTLNFRTHLQEALIQNNLFEKYDTTYYSIIILGAAFKEVGNLIVEHNEFRQIRCYNPKAKSRYNCLMYGKRNSYSFNVFTGATIPVVYARGSINILKNTIQVSGGQKDDGTFLLKGNHLVKPNLVALNKITGKGQSAIYSEVSGVEYIFANHFDIDNKRALIRLNPEIRSQKVKISDNYMRNREGGGVVGNHIDSLLVEHNEINAKYQILGNRSNSPEELKVGYFGVSNNVLRTASWGSRKINVKRLEFNDNIVYYGDGNIEYEIDASEQAFIHGNQVGINDQITFRHKNKANLFQVNTPKLLFNENQVDAPILRSGILKVSSPDIEIKQNTIDMKPTRPGQVLMVEKSEKVVMEENSVKSTNDVELFRSDRKIPQLKNHNNSGARLGAGKVVSKKVKD